MNTPEMALILGPNEDGEPGLLRVPLFISIAATIYNEEQSFRNKGDLLEKYIEHQLSFDVRKDNRSDKRFAGRKWAFKTVEGECDRSEVRHSLTWLAGQLRRQNQVDLLIEKMQPSWLDSPAADRRWLIFSLTFVVIGGLIGGPIGGLIFGLISLIGPDDIQPVEGFRISMSCEVRRKILRSLKQWLTGGLIFGLTFGLTSGLPIGLIKGLERNLKVQSTPNQGIWNSLQSAIGTTILSCPAAVILTMIGPVLIRVAEKHDWMDLIGIYIRNSPQFLPKGVFFALFIGISAGGGLACIKHLSLRIVLTQEKKIPWNYARFLNYCAERRLLQRIGGRYRFIHRELLDHFGIEN